MVPQNGLNDIIREVHWKPPSSCLAFEEPVGGALEDALNGRPGDFIMVYHHVSSGQDYMLFFEVPNERLRVGCEINAESNGNELYHLWIEGAFLRGYRIGENPDHTVSQPFKVQMKEGEKLHLCSATREGDRFLVAHGMCGVSYLLSEFGVMDYRINLDSYTEGAIEVIEKVHVKDFGGVHHGT